MLRLQTIKYGEAKRNMVLDAKYYMGRRKNMVYDARENLENIEMQIKIIKQQKNLPNKRQKFEIEFIENAGPEANK